MRFSPETCRVKPLRRIKTQLLHLVGLISLLQSMMLGTTNIKNLGDCRWLVYIYMFIIFYIHGSLHRNPILKRHNKMQQIQVFIYCKSLSTCFGCPSYPSSEEHKRVTAASGTGHSAWATTFLRRDLIRPRWRKVVTRICDMTCTRSCSYTFMYSWRWVRWTPETFRVNLQ